MTNYEISIEGITKEILSRETQLRLRRCWYVNGQSTPYQFTPHSFYVTGYKIMQEIKLLKLIRKDMHNLFVG